MRSNTKRTLVIIIIIAVSILLGFVTDAVWSKLEKKGHPTEYEDIVEKYAKQYNIPQYVIFAVIKTESDFDSLAVSNAGAMGLMQMMPSTFEWLTGEEHMNENLPKTKLLDPEVSIRYGTYYLAYLRARFAKDTQDVGGLAIASATDWDVIFAAYNGGEGNVAKWLKDPECVDENGKLVNIPFQETRSYVSKVNDAINTYKKIYSEKF